MKSLLIDVETASDIDIGKCGSFRYIEDDSFKLLLFGYSVDEAPAVVVDCTAGEQIPQDIVDAIYDPKVLKIAHNGSFEREVFRKVFHRYTPPEQWLDTMHLSAHCGLPLSLAQVCEALGFPEDKAKMSVGKKLIREFCCPVKPTKKFNMATHITPDMDPENWEIFKQYCARDVDTELLVWQKLRRWTPDDTERRFWCLDQRINEKGIRADLTLAKNAMDFDARYKAELTDKAISLTGLDNPSSVMQVKDWLMEQEGIEVPTLNKKAVADVVAQLQTNRAKDFMAIRTELSKTSTKKYDAFLRCACRDDHIKGCFQFFGGHTGRFAGRLVQLQNLAQNHLDDLDDARSIVKDGDYDFFRFMYPSTSDALSQLIRTTLIPEDGHQFLVADFSAVEARVAAYLTGEQWRLDTFASGGDIYCASASQMFKVPVEKHGVNGHLRQKGKIAELALGYGGGVNALRAFGADKLGMTEEDMAETVDKWREASPHIVFAWKSIENAMIRCITRKQISKDQVCGISFKWSGDIVWMQLPSGRAMAYYQPRYEPSQRNNGRNAISYMGVQQQTRKWARIETFGGRLFENLVQAVARDLLRDAMVRMTAAGFDIRAHVHDECIVSEPMDGRTVEKMAELMGQTPDWAKGLPLRADGYACSSYRKD